MIIQIDNIRIITEHIYRIETNNENTLLWIEYVNRVESNYFEIKPEELAARDGVLIYSTTNRYKTMRGLFNDLPIETQRKYYGEASKIINMLVSFILDHMPKQKTYPVFILHKYDK